MFSDRTPIYVGAITFLLIVATPYAAAGVPIRSQDGPLRVVESYLRATQARDFGTAYSYISNTDQRIRDKAGYLRSQEYLSGFALELANRLVAKMKVWVINQKVGPAKARFEVGYRRPAGDEISSRLFDWNASKLNALPQSEQRRLAEALENFQRSGKMVSLEGHETLDLVREKDGWKIFLDWAARSRVIFASTTPSSGALEVQFPRNDFLVATNEPFQIDFTVRNRSPRATVARLTHLIEPRGLAKNVEMIACGSLSPLRLKPGQAREVSSSYILGGDLSPRSRLLIIYQFTLESKLAATNPSRE